MDPRKGGEEKQTSSLAELLRPTTSLNKKEEELVLLLKQLNSLSLVSFPPNFAGSSISDWESAYIQSTNVIAEVLKQLNDQEALDKLYSETILDRFLPWFLGGSTIYLFTTGLRGLFEMRRKLKETLLERIYALLEDVKKNFTRIDFKEFAIDLKRLLKASSLSLKKLPEFSELPDYKRTVESHDEISILSFAATLDCEVLIWMLVKYQIEYERTECKDAKHEDIKIVGNPSPLMTACLWGDGQGENLRVVEYLSQYCDLNTFFHGICPLQVSVLKKNENLAKTLLLNGANHTLANIDYAQSGDNLTFNLLRTCHVIKRAVSYFSQTNLSEDKRLIMAKREIIKAHQIDAYQRDSFFHPSFVFKLLRKTIKNINQKIQEELRGNRLKTIEDIRNIEEIIEKKYPFLKFFLEALKHETLTERKLCFYSGGFFNFGGITPSWYFDAKHFFKHDVRVTNLRRPLFSSRVDVIRFLAPFLQEHLLSKEPLSIQKLLSIEFPELDSFSFEKKMMSSGPSQLAGIDSKIDFRTLSDREEEIFDSEPPSPLSPSYEEKMGYQPHSLKEMMDSESEFSQPKTSIEPLPMFTSAASDEKQNLSSITDDNPILNRSQIPDIIRATVGYLSGDLPKNGRLLMAKREIIKAYQIDEMTVLYLFADAIDHINQKILENAKLKTADIHIEEKYPFLRFFLYVLKQEVLSDHQLCSDSRGFKYFHDEIIPSLREYISNKVKYFPWEPLFLNQNELDQFVEPFFPKKNVRESDDELVEVEEPASDPEQDQDSEPDEDKIRVTSVQASMFYTSDEEENSSTAKNAPLAIQPKKS